MCLCESHCQVAALLPVTLTFSAVSTVKISIYYNIKVAYCTVVLKKDVIVKLESWCVEVK